MKSVSRETYLSHKPHPGNAFIQSLTEECAWFTHDHLLGIVLLDRVDGDWSIVVQGKDRNGKYRCIDMAVSFSSEAEAEERLLEMFQKHEKETVFSQGDEEALS